jgi:hypothetical protein
LNGVITYKKVRLEPYSNYSETSNSNFYEFKTYQDTASYDTTDMFDITTLPMMFKSEIYRQFCLKTLSQYDEVNVIIKIDNTDSELFFKKEITLGENDFIFRYKTFAIAEFDVFINGMDLIKNVYNNSIINLSAKIDKLKD